MELLYIFFALLLLHYVYFVLSIYFGLVKLKKVTTSLNSQNELNSHSISIIIPFRNESEVIQKNLSSLENLNFPTDRFEVIYVDDYSDDDSVKILNENISKGNVRVVQLHESNASSANKKRAVEYGISLAKGEIIFASDADCIYNSNWLKVMLKYMDEKTGFVAGPVDFETSNSLLSKAQQVEHASLILTGAGLIGIGNPIICSGANIAFRKKVFTKVDGYSGYSNLASGDDSFLMTKVFYDSEYEVRFCYDKLAMVRTRANRNLSEFFNQRKRWFGKAMFYKKKLILSQIILLTLFLLSLPFGLLLGLFLDPIFLYVFGIGIILKIITEYIVMKTGSNNLYDRKIMKWFLITEFLHIPYTVITSLFGIFGKFDWKGRELKK